MSIQVEQWRQAIGIFGGGNSSRASRRGQVSSSRMSKHQSTYLFLIMVIFLSQFSGGATAITKFTQYCARSPNPDQKSPSSSLVISAEFSTIVITPTQPSFYLSRKARNKLVKSVSGNRVNRGIKLAHWNAGSAYLCNKMNELEQVVGGLHPHVLGISEANFRKNHQLEDVQIEGYDLILSKTINNDELQISRIACYKHSSIVGKVREDLMCDSFSSIWLEIGLPGKKRFLVCQLYREWQYMGQGNNDSRSVPEQLVRWLLFLEQWERALASGHEVIVLGDVNLDHLKFHDSGELQPLVDKMFEQVYPHGVHQLVQVATRSWPGQADSGPDHIYTNCPEKLSNPVAQFRGSSDHKLIYTTKYAKNIRENIRYCKRRSYKYFDEQKFLAEVKRLSWWDVYNSTDVDQAVFHFTKKITDILDTMAPVRKFQMRSNYAAWISEGTKVLIKERDKAQELAAATKNVEDWRRYKRIRNQVTSLIRREKLSWQKRKLETAEEIQDSGKLWKTVLGWLNWSSAGSPSKLIHEGKLVTSPSKIADIQNEFYINKVRKIRQELPHSNTDPLEILRQRLSGNTASFSFSAVHPDEVEKIISSLKNSKASGIDDLDTYILKLIKKEAVPAICHILNLSIQTNRFPTRWKVAKVVPLYKGKGSKFESKNYRPVAILPVLSKVLERVVFIQLVRYMDQNRFFNPSHHGYRSFHSTTTAMLQMYDMWVTSLEKGELAGVVMVDMSAAFDVVDTELLLQK